MKKVLDGLKVRDAKVPLEIHVTARDIAKGKPNDPCACAFAVAIMRTTGASQARVTASRAYVEDKGIYRRYLVSKGVKRQLQLFDRTGDLGEGVYEMPTIPPSQALGVRFTITDSGAVKRPPLLKQRRPPRYKSD